MSEIPRATVALLSARRHHPGRQHTLAWRCLQQTLGAAERGACNWPWLVNRQAGLSGSRVAVSLSVQTVLGSNPGCVRTRVMNYSAHTCLSFRKNPQIFRKYFCGFGRLCFFTCCRTDATPAPSKPTAACGPRHLPGALQVNATLSAAIVWGRCGRCAPDYVMLLTPR